MLVQDILERWARKKPEHIALVAGEDRLTYAELDADANRIAQALRAAGVVRGDRVLILLDNGARAVEALFAVLKADATFVLVPANTKPARVATVIEDATPTALITDAARVPQLAGALSATTSLRAILSTGETPEPIGATRCIGWAEVARQLATPPARASIDVDLACLVYTSGTTGRPKGVMVTHANMRAAIDSVDAYLRHTEQDVICSGLPLSFSYGLYQPLLAFNAGARVVLERDLSFPAHTMAVLRQEHVTGFPGVPTVFAMLVRYPRLLEGQLPHLRYITNAGAALPVAHIEQLRQVFPDVRLYSMYGQTECKRISYLPPDELDRRPGSVGVAIPNTEVFIVDEHDQRVGPGEIGELVVRGSHVSRGYWRAPELTAQRFRPGPVAGETVLYTGDLFRTDDQGFLYFIARRDDIIKSRGEKVSPREIEEVVCQLPEIAEAAVVGVPDPILGQAVHLCVALRPGVVLGQQKIRAHCARLLDDVMVPKYIEVVSELPRTVNGKVDKMSIRAACARVEVEKEAMPGSG